ncbi:MAG: DUF4265 domain-containing protein [Pseudomonadales bacterium]|nr:DUF4265 domain-containing protein [Pseudomonadales bacterium]
MASPAEETVIHLLAGQRKDGDFVYEDIRAVAVGDGCYRLLHSPLFARGAVKDDVVRTYAAGQFEVETHGGNLAIRVMAKDDAAVIKQRLEPYLKDLNPDLDYENERSLVYNIHIKKGFDAIEKAFNQALQGRDDAVWLYANVYDPVDGETPLNWWHDYLAK